MALFGRTKRAESESADPLRAQPSYHVLGGDTTLEVVGESFNQEALLAVAGCPPNDGVRVDAHAVLVPQFDNPHDANAIAIQIGGFHVGHLSRADAAIYRPGLLRLMADGRHVVLRGSIVCGRDGGMFGVFLDHDPADFGVEPNRPPWISTGEMRTGFTEAWLTDLADDSYDLSWYSRLPDGDRPAIKVLRGLLAEDPDPIDRHFQFAELEARLYHCRDIDENALSEFDEACRQHDAEMEGICAAFMAKWSRIPMLEIYKQMAIRQSKANDWSACLWWVDRGLAFYGEDAARVDAVEDLERRRVRALAKLQPPSPKKAQQPAKQLMALPPPIGPPVDLSPPAGMEFETLRCRSCGREFERRVVRGRKPADCPVCRADS